MVSANKFKLPVINFKSSYVALNNFDIYTLF